MTDKKLPKLPDGYKDAEAFLTECRERYEQGLQYDRINREEGEQDLKFLAGEQWDHSARTIRERGGRPCLTINRLPQFIAQIVGDIRINKPAIKVRPAEDADKDLADIREGLIRSIERNSDAQGVYSSAGQDQVACGIGNFRINLDYAADDVFDIDITVRRVADPFSVVWDPLILDPTGRDAKWVFVEDSMSRTAFDKAFPDMAPSELQARDSRWCSPDTVKVTEYWIQHEEPTELVLMPDGKVLEATNENRPLAVKTRKASRTCWRMYLTNGYDILGGPYELKISRPPVFRVPGWEMMIAGRKSRWGLIRFAKDPQRLLNYWRSVAAEVLALQPRATWLLNTTQSGVDPDMIEDFTSGAETGATVLEWGGQVAPQRIDPPAFPAALIQEAALNAQDMKDVTGLHDASLGAKSNETSGKAILARQKEGDVASYIYHDNLQAAIRECGKVINELIPAVYDTARTIRVVGEDEATKVQRINDPNSPDSVDMSKGKYDVVVETGPSYSTKRAEASESMMQFVQAVPAAAQVAGDIIAQVQDWPMADKLGERLKKMLPPGMAEEDDEDPTPEQMQAKQMAMQQAQEQQQLAQRMATLQVDEQEAKVAKLEAEAMAISAPEPQQEGKPFALELAMAELRTANANADKAEAEAEKARLEIPALIVKGEAEAERALVGAEADVMDLDRKPLEQAHQEADLDIKLNPPEETTAA